MLKTLVLQAINNATDEQLESPFKDTLSFIRFLGIKNQSSYFQMPKQFCKFPETPLQTREDPRKQEPSALHHTFNFSLGPPTPWEKFFPKFPKKSPDRFLPSRNPEVPGLNDRIRVTRIGIRAFFPVCKNQDTNPESA